MGTYVLHPFSPGRSRRHALVPNKRPVSKWTNWIVDTSRGAVIVADDGLRSTSLSSSTATGTTINWELELYVFIKPSDRIEQSWERNRVFGDKYVIVPPTFYCRREDMPKYNIRSELGQALVWIRSVQVGRFDTLSHRMGYIETYGSKIDNIPS